MQRSLRAAPTGAPAPAPATTTSAPILEVDEHHHVTRGLAHQGAAGCLLFFDSHDDLGPPSRLLGAAALAALRRPGARAAEPALDIGTWILPALYARAFSTLLWVSAWTTNLPRASFTALVGPHKFEDCGVALAVACGAGVPADWRALWADYCLPAAALSPAQRKAMVPFRVVHTDAAGALRCIRQWQRAGGSSGSSSGGGGSGGVGSGGGGGGTPPSSRKRRASSSGAAAAAAAAAAASPAPEDAPPLPASYQISIDLDYFSVRNPALRGIPWTEHPSFRRELVALARCVPMHRGGDFVAALQALAASQDPAAALPRVLRCGVPPPATPGAALTLLSLLGAIAARFAADLHGPAHLQAVLASLLLANLAEHESTEEELQALEEGCAAAMAAAFACAGGAQQPPVLIARSEMYTPRRQLQGILERARRAVAAAAAAAAEAAR